VPTDSVSGPVHTGIDTVSAVAPAPPADAPDALACDTVDPLALGPPVDRSPLAFPLRR